MTIRAAHLLHDVESARALLAKALYGSVLDPEMTAAECIAAVHKVGMCAELCARLHVELMRLSGHQVSMREAPDAMAVNWRNTGA